MRSSVTKESLKSRPRGKLPMDKQRLIILVIMGTRIAAQSFNKEVGIGSSSHCLLGRDCNRLYISVSDGIMLVGKYLVMPVCGKGESHE